MKELGRQSIGRAGAWYTMERGGRSQVARED